MHTTFKYYEHFSLPAVTTPNYICYISLNRLAVLFEALAYTRCPHLTSCSEVTTIILGEVSTWRPIISVQFIPKLGTDFPLNLKDRVCFWKIRFWRSYGSYLLAFSTINSRGKMSYKMPTAIVGFFFFFYLFQQNDSDTEEKGSSCTRSWTQRTVCTDTHHSLHLSRCSFKCFMTLVNSQSPFKGSKMTLPETRDGCAGKKAGPKFLFKSWTKICLASVAYLKLQVKTQKNYSPSWMGPGCLPHRLESSWWYESQKFGMLRC